MATKTAFLSLLRWTQQFSLSGTLLALVRYMKQLEILELRGMNLKQDIVQIALNDIRKLSITDFDGADVQIYWHSTVETDVAIHIHHERTESLEGGSPLGYHLVSFLRKFGLVKHNVWSLF